MHTDVDMVIFPFVGLRSKSKREVAALHSCYPGARTHLRWSTARLRVLGAATAVQHHTPLHWSVAVASAGRCELGGLPRHAAVIVLQWRFGLRLTVASRHQGEDIHAHWLRPSWGG